MFHDLLYPNGLLYILIKLTVLALAVFLWFMIVSPGCLKKPCSCNRLALSSTISVLCNA